MKTKEKLALALEAAGAPSGMVRDARAGRFDDFESPSATPTIDLVELAMQYGLHEIARRAREGEFDCTREESEAWASSQTDPELVGLLGLLEAGVKGRPWRRSVGGEDH